jgi:hypothetical protein
VHAVRRLLTLGLALMCLAVSGSAAQDSSAGRTRLIRGQVVDAVESAALRRASVVVSSGSRRIEQAFTDDNGRFAITLSVAGELSIRASKAGYTAVSATASGDAADAEIRFALARSIAVWGRVLGSDGAPLERAYAIARAVLPDGRRLESESSRFFTQTDRFGDYRLGGLPAGRYEIAAVRVPPELRTPRSRVEDQLFGPQQLLESAPNRAIVAPPPGGEAGNVDFVVASTPDVTCVEGPSVRPATGSRTSSVRGRVIGASGMPLACASVRIVAPDAPVPEVFTDREGRYSIEGLTAGVFVLEARERTHIPLQNGQRGPADRPTPIELREEEERTNVDFVLPRHPFIAGTVVDEHGEPLEGIAVTAFHLQRRDGMLGMGAPASGTTDDRGRYRVIPFQPGTYVVVATALGAVSIAGTHGYTPTFYPGAADAATAGRVTVDAGRDAAGIDITLTPRFLATVSGSIASADGAPPAGMVSLGVSSRSAAVPFSSWSASPDATGRFVIRNVPPGEYVVKAVDPADPPRFGMHHVTVADTDPPPLTIVTTRGTTVEGTIVAPHDANLVSLTVSAVPADFDYSPAAGSFRLTRVAREADGSFRLPGVTGPSRLQIEVPACQGCYVVSAFVNGRDALDTPFDFGLSDAVYRGAEIVISDAGATLEGRIVRERGDEAARVSVVAFSAFRDLWYPQSRHIKIAPVAAGEPFQVPGLPPGDYLVAAVAGTGALSLEGDVTDPETLEQLSRRAARVTLRERERRSLDLRLVRP